MDSTTTSPLAEPFVRFTILLALLLLNQAAFGFQADSDVEKYAPDALSIDEFSALGSDWEDWGTKTAELIIELYEGSGSLEDTRRIVPELRQRVGNLDDAIRDPKNAALKNKLRVLRQRLDRRVAVMEAALRGMADDNSPAAQKQVEKVLVAIEAFEKDSRRTSIKSFRTVYNELKKSFPKISAELSPVIIQYYYNYNLHLSVPEDLIGPLIRETRTESGVVDDCILGAKVDGCQTTRATASIDVKPSVNGARLDFVLSGQTHTNTQGVKKPGVVYTRGTHTFVARKDVVFDGRQLVMGQTRTSVRINNKTVGAKTDYDWVPILGWFGLARSIAMNEARSKKSQTDAIARKKLLDKLLPRFEDEISTRINEANDGLKTGVERLQNAGLFPEDIDSRSSETHLAISTRTVAGGQFGGNAPQNIVVPQNAIALQMHESLINNVLDQFELEGKSYNEEQLQAHMEDVLSRKLGREIKFPEPADGEAKEADEDEEDPPTFVFDPTDPLRVEFEDKRINVILRTGLIQGDRNIPLQEIRIPLNYRLENDILILEPGKPQIKSIKKANRFQQISRAAQIQRVLKSRLPRREINTGLEIKLDEKRTAKMVPELLESADGWLSLILKRSSGG